jgi:serine/threonine protein kinase
METLTGTSSTYSIVEEIARGGMGAVYRAHDDRSGEIVAIKEACLDPAECQGNRQQIRARLLHEMDVLFPLNHPNIPSMFDQFSHGMNEYLVMEFIQGPTIMQIHRQAQSDSRQLEESRVLGWAIQVLDTLTYLHEQPKPIIHRDIKPENLILSSDGRVVLIDFGLMKQVERQLELSGPLIRSTGTVEYAPPEQYADSGATTDARSDIYSLGATLYYLLCGTLPPKAIDRILPMSVDIARRVAPLREANPTVSSHMQRVIEKALEIDPQKRYQTARDMREALAPRRRFINLPF